MTTIYPADPCAPVIHHPPPTAKTVREVAMEAEFDEAKQLLRELLPFVLVDTQPTEKTQAFIARVTRVIG